MSALGLQRLSTYGREAFIGDLKEICRGRSEVPEIDQLPPVPSKR